jgi:hypothetical protein
VSVYARALPELVVYTSGQAPSAAVVTVFAEVRVVEKPLGSSTGKSGDVRRGLHVIDPTARPIVTASDQRPEAFLATESLADRSGRFNLPAPSEDRHVPAHAAEIDRGLIGGGLSYKIHGAANAVSIHIWQKRLINLHGLDNVSGEGIKFNLADACLRRGNVHPVDHRVGEAWLEATDLYIFTFALIALLFNALQPT